MNELSYNDAPEDWAICFDGECPRALQCLRQHVAQLAPQNLTTRCVVLPAARCGDMCQLFVPDRPSLLARGMKKLFKGIDPVLLPAIRKEVSAVFGKKSHYYRYREGDYPITPAQQECVREIFRRHGLGTEPQYDHTETIWYFPSEKQ